jgi:hypothetical protein
MNSKGRGPIVIKLAVLLSICPASQIFAQSAPPPETPQAAPTQSPQPKEGRIIQNVTTVVVPVTVKDKAGRLVPDLRKDEFRIFEDNVEQAVTSFKVEAFPLSVVVLVDNDLKKKDADQVEESLRAVVAGMSIYDEAFVCRFDQLFARGAI